MIKNQNEANASASSKEIFLILNVVFKEINDDDQEFDDIDDGMNLINTISFY